MARYFYDKHTITTSYSYSNRRPLSGTTSGFYHKDTIVHTGYGFSSGFYGTGANTFYNIYIIGTHDIYLVSDTSVYKVTVATQIGDNFDFSASGVEQCDKSQVYSKGAYIETVTADDGTYPVNGMQGGYWWVKGALAFPSLKIRIGNELKTSEMGWIRVNDELKEIEKIWVRIGGALKEVI